MMIHPKHEPYFHFITYFHLEMKTWVYAHIFISDLHVAPPPHDGIAGFAFCFFVCLVMPSFLHCFLLQPVLMCTEHSGYQTCR
jgi:hypothetical protein